MSMLQPKLHLKVAQKQILTPSLVQMVSVLALNRLELREMINQEIMANPVLEELGEDGVIAEKYTDEAFLEKETEKIPETEAPNPFDEFDVSAFLNTYLNSAGDNNFREREQIEKPSFEQFVSSPQKLADHLAWQLGATPIDERTKEIAEEIIGNLNEDGYLTVTLEEICQLEECTPEQAEAALKALNELGYSCDTFALDAARFVPQSRLRLFVADGRAYLARDARSYDAILLDAFAGGDVPEHLRMLAEAGARPAAVRRPEELEAVDGLVWRRGTRWW